MIDYHMISQIAKKIVLLYVYCTRVHVHVVIVEKEPIINRVTTFWSA